MTIEDEIEAITERLKYLKECRSKGANERIDASKKKFMERADTLDPKFKELYHNIDNAVNSAGWKDFYYGVFNYQKNCIDSGYIFK